ncbi:glycoside hydrolase family 127 protein [Nesterenkonia alba]|uniref:glycoside hydrolase family 127 protein n=1 Tax=Nesterenkonia alba TaxID=515814 RepID=UPI00146B2C7E|nr:beta-L-arabinofuranosidase domain-containing protein [Nesterenkonia alba]
MTAHALGGPVQPSTGALRPLTSGEVGITGGFWGDLQRLSATAVIDHALNMMEQHGWLENFDRAASGELKGKPNGMWFVDSESYKILEAMAWALGSEQRTEELEEKYHALVARVAAAQEPDGYLHTYYGREGQEPRWSNMEMGHELYCFGHLLQAGVARLRTGYDDALVEVCRRVADHVVAEFGGPQGRNAICGHAEIEMALLEFGRATGVQAYQDVARLFIERHGDKTLKPTHGDSRTYYQDDEKVREVDVLSGHAVRALYLACGAADVAVEFGDTELAEAVQTQWSNTVAKRTYITGGMGSTNMGEAFGADYQLPPDTSYAETCAGVASSMLSWRLLLATGVSRVK